jgi:hypothetical protein
MIGHSEHVEPIPRARTENCQQNRKANAGGAAEYRWSTVSTACNMLDSARKTAVSVEKFYVLPKLVGNEQPVAHVLRDESTIVVKNHPKMKRLQLDDT